MYLTTDLPHEFLHSTTNQSYASILHVRNKFKLVLNDFWLNSGILLRFIPYNLHFFPNYCLSTLFFTIFTIFQSETLKINVMICPFWPLTFTCYVCERCSKNVILLNILKIIQLLFLFNLRSFYKNRIPRKSCFIWCALTLISEHSPSAWGFYGPRLS